MTVTEFIDSYEKFIENFWWEGQGELENQQWLKKVILENNLTIDSTWVKEFLAKKF